MSLALVVITAKAPLSLICEALFDGEQLDFLSRDPGFFQGLRISSSLLSVRWFDCFIALPFFKLSFQKN